MNTSKIGVAIIILSAALTSACKTDEVAPAGCLLESTSLDYGGGGTYVQTYHYDDHKRLTSISVQVINPPAAPQQRDSIVYSYDANGLVATVREGTQRHQAWTYSGPYLRSVAVWDPAYSDSASLIYYYSLAHVTSFKFIQNQLCCGSSTEIGSLGYSGDNVVLETIEDSYVTDQGAIIHQTKSLTFEYDTKNNPLLLVAASLGHQVFNPSPYTPFPADLSKNNVTKYVQTEFGTSTNTYFKYEYNSDGYPTKSTQTEDQSSQTTITTYTYINCR